MDFTNITVLQITSFWHNYHIQNFKADLMGKMLTTQPP